MAGWLTHTHATHLQNFDLAIKLFVILLNNSPGTTCADKLGEVLAAFVALTDTVHSLTKSMWSLMGDIIRQWLDGDDPLAACTPGCSAELPVALFAASALYCPGPSSGHAGRLNFPGGYSVPCSPVSVPHAHAMGTSSWPAAVWHITRIRGRHVWCDPLLPAPPPSHTHTHKRCLTLQWCTCTTVLPATA